MATDAENPADPDGPRLPVSLRIHADTTALAAALAPLAVQLGRAFAGMGEALRATGRALHRMLRAQRRTIRPRTRRERSAARRTMLRHYRAHLAVDRHDGRLAREQRREAADRVPLWKRARDGIWTTRHDLVARTRPGRVRYHARTRRRAGR